MALVRWGVVAIPITADDSTKKAPVVSGLVVEHRRSLSLCRDRDRRQTCTTPVQRHTSVLKQPDRCP